MDASSGSASSKAQKCAGESSLKWSSISTCFSGDEGTKLKSAAATYFDKRFPSPIGVPHIEINGKSPADRSEAALIKALCDAGIKAGACKHDIIV